MIKIQTLVQFPLTLMKNELQRKLFPFTIFSPSLDYSSYSQISNFHESWFLVDLAMMFLILFHPRLSPIKEKIFLLTFVAIIWKILYSHADSLLRIHRITILRIELREERLLIFLNIIIKCIHFPSKQLFRFPYVEVRCLERNIITKHVC